ncbi:5'-nucleotidase C-terminal domain-containing protein, partial [Paraburkholderia sp. SIMBA_027]|uniref:5'-nucleotidase C-terminal domain-containing protein n=1 Tax=Paraburkholderia sp. SIMBA_027 TaxID=3085770 RepID=UPI00397E3AA7
MGEVISVLPFGNTLALMDVTGAELKAAFEVSVSKYPEENGGFLHVSKGTKVVFDSSKPAGSRIVSITVKDANGHEVAIEE